MHVFAREVLVNVARLTSASAAISLMCDFPPSSNMPAASVSKATLRRTGLVRPALPRKWSPERCAPRIFHAFDASGYAEPSLSSQRGSWGQLIWFLCAGRGLIQNWVA